MLNNLIEDRSNHALVPFIKEALTETAAVLVLGNKKNPSNYLIQASILESLVFVPPGATLWVLSRLFSLLILSLPWNTACATSIVPTIRPALFITIV